MSDRFVILGGNGVLPPIIDREEDARRAEEEAAEAIKTEMRALVAAAQQEKIDIALGELEAELIKVVRAELAEELAARKTPAKTLASYKKHLAVPFLVRVVPATAQSTTAGGCCCLPGTHGHHRRHPQGSQERG